MRSLNGSDLTGRTEIQALIERDSNSQICKRALKITGIEPEHYNTSYEKDRIRTWISIVRSLMVEPTTSFKRTGLERGEIRYELRSYRTPTGRSEIRALKVTGFEPEDCNTTFQKDSIRTGRSEIRALKITGFEPEDCNTSFEKDRVRTRRSEIRALEITGFEPDDCDTSFEKDRIRTGRSIVRSLMVELNPSFKRRGLERREIRYKLRNYRTRTGRNEKQALKIIRFEPETEIRVFRRKGFKPGELKCDLGRWSWWDSNMRHRI